MKRRTVLAVWCRDALRSIEPSPICGPGDHQGGWPVVEITEVPPGISDQQAREAWDQTVHVGHSRPTARRSFRLSELGIGRVIHEPPEKKPDAPLTVPTLKRTIGVSDR